MATPSLIDDKQNKRAIREMFREAFELLGGVDWLVSFANRSDENARAFVSAITKMIPLEVTGKDGQPLTITVVTEPLEEVVSDVIEGEVLGPPQLH